MAKLAITDFFKSIDAPLHNYVWSWGAVTAASNDVVFRVWNDEGEIIDSKKHFRLSLHEKWRAMDGKAANGYSERLRHIEIAKKNGRAFFVYCRAEDVNEVPRNIAGYADHVIGVCENIVEDEFGNFWGEESRRISKSDFISLIQGPA
jgi:hypothetical protein